MNKSVTNLLTWLNATLALLFGLGAAWYLFASFRAAEAASRLHAHAVDAGVMERLTAWTYFVPNTLLFAIVAVAMWKGWLFRWFAQCIALSWLIGPVAYAFIPDGV